MNPDDIELSTASKAFAYEKIRREIEELKDIQMCKAVAMAYAKLYFKQQETIARI